jgi:hypothetical protein
VQLHSAVRHLLGLGNSGDLAAEGSTDIGSFSDADEMSFPKYAAELA